MNIIESLLKTGTQPPHPMHAGEVFVVWSLYVGVKESRVLCLLMLNHTKDPSLKEMIEHIVADLEKPLVQKLKHVLSHEGIDIPAGTGDKARANEASIPPGAKLTDAEIANLLIVKLQGMLNLCHFGIGQALREDLGILLLQAYQHLVGQGFTLQKLMRERGWLRVPPLFPFNPNATSH